jgi:hypothetical protein
VLQYVLCCLSPAKEITDKDLDECFVDVLIMMIWLLQSLVRALPMVQPLTSAA